MTLKMQLNHLIPTEKYKQFVQSSSEILWISLEIVVGNGIWSD